MQQLMGQMRAAMERYHMAPPGSHIAVGVSGERTRFSCCARSRSCGSIIPTLSR